MAKGTKRPRADASSGLHTVGETHQVQGFVMTEHFFKVPLDHADESQGTITIFAREVVATSKEGSNQPYLCFLQGGPGCESPRPTEHHGWIKEACKNFTVVLLDQRGTGRSSPIRASVLQAKGSTEEQVAYLRHFRADSIVLDAEHVRESLVPKDSCEGRWSILGQSFGGFCATTYLSFAPEGLVEAFMTGGIPPVVHQPCPAEIVYQHTFQRVIVQNKKYYTRFPGDVAVVRDIVRFLASQPKGGVQTPSGTWIRPRTLQLLGLSGLGSGGGFESLHYLLESALDRNGPNGPELTPNFIKAFETNMPWDTNPLFAVLHEACYSQGPATGWAAQRVRDSEAFADLFDAEKAAAVADGVVFFTGEMIFPWMFDDFAALRPLKAVAEAVAAADGWSRLYDVPTLRRNKVPVCTATYVEDMYVDFNLAQQTSQHIANIRQWMTNEYMHSGIRDDGARIFDRLLAMCRGSIVNF